MAAGVAPQNTADRDEDRRLAEAFRALPPGSGALRREGVRTLAPSEVRRAAAEGRPAIYVNPERRGNEALPPGSAETWDVLGLGPWPGR